jgi:hypothetical protein
MLLKHKHIHTQRVSVNALTSPCHSRPCRTLVNYQLNYSDVSSQPPLQISTDCQTSTLNSQLTTARLVAISHQFLALLFTD